MKPLVGIIGCEGKMGKAFGELFSSRAFSVIGSDLHTTMKNEDVARRADILLFSVPISVTPALIAKLAPLMKRSALITDLTSVKLPALQSMMNHAPKTTEILGLHPMFNASMVSDMHRQVFVVCPMRSGPHAEYFLDFLRKEGALLKESTPEEHDKMMSVIQGLTHISSIATGMALKTLGFNLQESFSFSSPIYRLRLEMVGRILSQSPDLYAEIAIENPLTMTSMKAYQEAIQLLSQRIADHDRSGFIQDFMAAAAFFGDFKDDAYHRTNELLTRSKDIL